MRTCLRKCLRIPLQTPSRTPSQTSSGVRRLSRRHEILVPRDAAPVKGGRKGVCEDVRRGVLKYSVMSHLNSIIMFMYIFKIYLYSVFYLCIFYL